MIKTLIILLTSLYLLLALWSPFANRSTNINKDLVDKLTFSKEEKLDSLNYTKEDIIFLRRYNLAMDSREVNKNYVLNVSVEKNLSSLKKVIAYLESKGYRALYYRLDSFYYVVVGYFDSFEKALEVKKDLKAFKNIYPMYNV